MMQKIDRSKWLARMLDVTSAGLARRRGLPVVIGIVLITVALVLQVVAFAANSRVLDIAAVIIHSIGVLFALIGLALTTPLGK
jgi:hypothetical protein